MDEVLESVALSGSPALDVEEVANEIDTDAHERTVKIGRALIERRNEPGTVPFEGKTRFLKWAGEQIHFSASTARNALEETGCFVAGKQGSSAGLRQAVRNVIEYAETAEGLNSEN
jgi:hypothetical protein